MTSGASPVISPPPNTMRPEVGVCRPAMTLKSVDLPAPLGPMTEKTSPTRTSKLTPESAARAPKLFDTPSTASTTPAVIPSTPDTSSGGLPPGPGAHPPSEAQEPMGREEHDDDEHEPDHDRVPLHVRCQGTLSHGILVRPPRTILRQGSVCCRGRPPRLPRRGRCPSQADHLRLECTTGRASGGTRVDAGAALRFPCAAGARRGPRSVAPAPSRRPGRRRAC